LRHSRIERAVIGVTNYGSYGVEVALLSPPGRLPASRAAIRRQCKQHYPQSRSAIDRRHL